MGLADDLYAIGGKIDAIKAIKPEAVFNIKNMENALGVYFILRADGLDLTFSTATEVVDVLEALRSQYANE